MPTHKKVLSEVDAYVVDPDSPPLPTGVTEVTESVNGVDEKHYYVEGPDGQIQVRPGDYIVTDGNNDSYVVTAEDFANDYEAI